MKEYSKIYLLKNEEQQLIASLQSFSRKASVIVALIGCVVFLGWMLDITLLKSIMPGLVSMKTNTSISFIMSGLSLGLWHRKGTRKKSKTKKLSLLPYKICLAQVLAIIVILIGLLTLIQYGFGCNVGIDELIFKDPAGAVGTSAPGRMSTNSALSFLMLGSALLLLSRKLYYPAQCFSLVGFLIGFLGLLGYIYGIASFYGKSYNTGVALHTAIAFILLSLGIWFARPDRGWMAVVTSDMAGGLMARRMSLAAIGIPSVLGWFILLGHQSRLYESQVGLALFGVFNIIIFGFITWWNARFLNTVDNQRHRAEEALKHSNQELENRVQQRTIELSQANEQLQQQIAERQHTEDALQKSYNLLHSVIEGTTDAIFVKDIQGRYIMINSAGANIFGKSVEEVVGKNDAELLPSDSGSYVMEIDRTIMMSGKSQTLEEVVPMKNKNLTLLSTKNTYCDQQGDVIGLIGIARDISDRKQVEDALRQSETELKEKNQQLEHTLKELKRTQSQLIQSEKMSSLGQLVAGVAHEINNPVNFIYGNLTHVKEYSQDLLNLLQVYQQQYPNSTPELQETIEAIDLDFLREDFPNLLSSMKVGADRIREIVLSLRNFSRIDEAQMKEVDIHEGIDSTLMILHNRLKAKPDHPNIQVIKEYSNLPKVECYAGQLNQVFMNLVTNAIDALEELENCRVRRLEGSNQLSNVPSFKPSNPTIRIRTELLNSDRVVIKIADNGLGMTEEVRQQLFNPFFTTKPIGKGTGLGLAISYQIVVEKHGGQLQCLSAPGEGAEFTIEIPIRQMV